MRFFVQHIVLPFFLFFIIASSATAFNGKYIPYGAEGEGWDCGEVGMNRGAFQISGDRLTGLEYGCTLSNPSPANGLNATVFNGDCAAEGSQFSTQITLMPWEFDGSHGVYVMEEGYVQQWEFCAQIEGAEQGSMTGLSETWTYDTNAKTAQSGGGELRISCAPDSRYIGVNFNLIPQSGPDPYLILKVNGGGTHIFDDPQRTDSIDGSRFEIRYDQTERATRALVSLVEGFTTDGAVQIEVFQSEMLISLDGAADALGVCRDILAGEIARMEIAAPDEELEVTSPYDGTYQIAVGRVWRDDFWAGSDNPYYIPGNAERLSYAVVRYEGGNLELVEVAETNVSGGPVFEGFSGSVSEEGILSFQADVNFMVGKPAPYRLQASFDLNAWRNSTDAIVAETDDYDRAYHSHISLTAITGPNFEDGIASTASDQPEINEAERKRLTAEEAERERLAAEQAEGELTVQVLAAEAAERERPVAEEAALGAQNELNYIVPMSANMETRQRFEEAINGSGEWVATYEVLSDSGRDLTADIYYSLQALEAIGHAMFERSRSSLSQMEEILKSIPPSSQLTIAYRVGGGALEERVIDTPLSYNERSEYLFDGAGDIADILSSIAHVYSVEFKGDNEFSNMLCFVNPFNWTAVSSTPQNIGPASDAYREYGMPGLLLADLNSGATFGSLDEPMVLCNAFYPFPEEVEAYRLGFPFGVIVENEINVQDLYEGDVLLLSGKITRVAEYNVTVKLDNVQVLGEETVYPVGSGYEAEYR